MSGTVEGGERKRGGIKPQKEVWKDLLTWSDEGKQDKSEELKVQRKEEVEAKIWIQTQI